MNKEQMETMAPSIKKLMYVFESLARVCYEFLEKVEKDNNK